MRQSAVAAHKRTTQILAVHCKQAQWPGASLKEGGPRLGKYLGEAYHELFKHIVEADGEAET